MQKLLTALLLVVMMVHPGLAQKPSAAGFDNNADSVAVVIGNRNYKQTVQVDYAHNDAEAIKAYLVQSLGFREQNIVMLKDATYSEMNQVFGTESNPQSGRLWRSVAEGKSNVFVYYSGHGVPDLVTRQPFLLPQDGDPNQSESGYLLQTLYRNLELVKQKIGAGRQVVVMVDPCFTGETGRKGETMLAVSAPGFTPARPKVGQGIIRLTATSGATPANWDANNKLGLFTSRFLMAAAGLDQSRAAGESRPPLDWAELRAYVTREVEEAARRDVGRNQSPEIDTVSLALPAAEPIAAIRNAVERAQDEAMWRRAQAEGSRAAFERYVARCAGPCAFREEAIDRLLAKRRGAEVEKDDENWRRLSAEGKYQAYLDGCGNICAYRRLALGYLGKNSEPAPAAPAPVREQPAQNPDPGQAPEAVAKAFEAAEAAGTAAALDSFLKTYPKSALSEQARALRKEIAGRQPAAGAARKPYEPTAAEIKALAYRSREGSFYAQ